MAAIVQDARYAIRSLRRRLLLAAAAITSLALGIGAAPVVMGTAAALMVAIMVLAAALPVRRAMRVEPVAALRLD